MFKYIRQRVLWAILTLFIIAFFSYILIATYAPDPFEPVIENIKTTKKGMTEAQVNAFIDELRVTTGLARWEIINGEKLAVIYTPFERFFLYLGKIFKSGDFGFFINPANNPNSSIFTEEKGMAYLFFKPLSYTLIITGPAMLISTPLGIIIGVISGYKRGKTFDNVANFFATIIIGIPSFILAPIFISIFMSFGIPPRVFIGQDQTIGTKIISFIPPIIVMTIVSTVGFIAFTRNQVITVLSSNYILIAKTKGLSTWQIFSKYVLRNIFIPLIGAILGSFVGLLSGSIIIETYWSVPGTSNVIAHAFPMGEINIIMFSTLFFTLISLILTIIVDISYVLLDPRITYAQKSKRNYWLFFKAWKERRKIEKDLYQTHLQSQPAQISKGEK
ncbi:ABC transporter permease [[Mycoplasma] falconis]|uniref:ABC transporter permease n=1 Tax=[Mycoplasma] falconis TaxID=92403 RepID=A0A501XAD0_9BACT|nr:ABC transporter permease [[Mycoplasma] falconis]TPE57588.1 ABC transporter permease [[Mycoplasma] falconis]